MASGAWLRSSDDRAAECKAPRAVSEAPAGGEGGETGAVEVRLKRCMDMYGSACYYAHPSIYEDDND